MLKAQKIIEREERAKRLVEARKGAGFTGPIPAADRFGWNANSYKAHEQGRNGFEPATAKEYARAFNVNLQWLMFGTGAPTDPEMAPVSVTDVPLISWVSAGQFMDQDGVESFDDFPTTPAIDLPEGQWIALKVEGNSMNKISPPGSIIFVNMKDRRLVNNACYVVADETGAATYKRYRQGIAQPYQPASYDDVEAPTLQGAITVIGRVRRSFIEM